MYKTHKKPPPFYVPDIIQAKRAGIVLITSSPITQIYLYVTDITRQKQQNTI